MHYSVGFATDIGRKRSQNQDSFIALPEMGLFVVADGMGGHRGGETASAMVVDVVPAKVSESFQLPDWNARTLLVEAVRAANIAIYKRASEQSSLEGMGTTTTALLFKDGQLTIGHVGDSRCYYFSPNSVWQVTRDHSLVQERLRAGLITREEARTDRMKNVITRSVGFEPILDVEIYEMNVKPGDVFLICSDGLSGLVEDKRMLESVRKFVIDSNDPKRAVNELIETANGNGGDDNITVVVVKVLGN
ncbi:MAG: hypothetical protein A2428_01165 [Bdellovibrionales bacterium RIFOXYC1_FULL_54_43]|nr:MAG: hypothetical protein A2428_01165 [Bdellovibrionales bacterium RIFOXYC1_FULL_54_43]